MPESQKRSWIAQKQIASVLLLILCLLTSAFLLQTASATSTHPSIKHPQKTHNTPHTAKITRHTVTRTLHAQRATVTHPTVPAIQYARLNRPAFQTNHNLAFVNSLHLAGVTRPPHTAHRTHSTHTITTAQKNLVEFVDKTVYNLNYSSYRLGGGRFDTSHGIYVVDCSRFVDSVLSRVYPAAYSNLVNASGADRPASQHYYDFFSDLSPVGNDVHWNKVEKIGQLRPGDILVFRYRKPRGQAQGHVMVVMDKPRVAENGWIVRVADSAPIRHSADTRQPHESGIGIGSLLLKPSPTGKPAAYAWEMGGSWRKNVKFAMARPLKVDV